MIVYKTTKANSKWRIIRCARANFVTGAVWDNQVASITFQAGDYCVEIPKDELDEANKIISRYNVSVEANKLSFGALSAMIKEYGI